MTPRLCFVGPMVGRNPGFVTTQGEILSDHFRTNGYDVTSVSSSTNRYIRLLDILTTLIRRRHSTDVVLIQVYCERSFVVEDIASRLAQRLDLRIVMVLRSGKLPEFMNRFPSWTRRVLARAHALVAPSEFLARSILPCGLKATVIPNLIDLTAYPYRHRETVTARLFWLRTFHSYYNPLMAIRVLARLRSKVPDATLVMAGQDKGMEGETRELAAKLGCKDAVSFPGFLNMEGKTKIGRSTDIFLNTNQVDNTPVAVLEACAMGLPVVATKVGGIPDLLTDEKTGLLVPDDDDRAMADAIHRLLTEPGLAGRLSASGRELAESATWPKILPRWQQVLAGVMQV